MAGFKKLITLQLLSWFLFSLIGTFFVARGFDQAVSEAQVSTQTMVTRYIENKTLADVSPEHIELALNNGKVFSTFIVRDYEGKTVLQIATPNTLPFGVSLIESIFNSIRPQFAVNKAKDIKIEFVINASSQADLLQQALLLMFLISALVAFIPVVYMQAIYKRLNRRVSMTVADAVEVYITQNQQQSLVSSDFSTDDLEELGSDLAPSFNRLAQFLKTKQEDIQNAALSIKQEAYKDVVTGLGNRNMFVEYYEQQIESSPKKASERLLWYVVANCRLLTKPAVIKKATTTLNLFLKSFATSAARIRKAKFSV